MGHLGRVSVWAVTVSTHRQSTRVLCVFIDSRALYLRHECRLLITENSDQMLVVSCMTKCLGLVCFLIRVHVYAFMHTGGACRTMVTAKLSREFTTPKEAEESLKSLLEGGQEECDHVDEVSSPALSPVDSPFDANSISSCSPEENLATGQLPPCDPFSPISMHTIDRLLPSMRNLQIVDPLQQISCIGEMFTKAAETLGVDVPPDFLSLSLNAMRHLANSGRSNIVYGICKGLGTMREDGSDSVLPAKKLISGLLEYSIDFFNAGDAQNVSCVRYMRVLCDCLPDFSNRFTAQKTIEPGVRVCTRFLETSGSIYMRAPCGKWR